MLRPPGSIEELLAGLNPLGPSSPTMPGGMLDSGAMDAPSPAVPSLDLGGLDTQSMLPRPRVEPLQKRDFGNVLQMAAMILPMLMGGKDPRRSAAAMQGFFRGQEMARGEQLDVERRNQEKKEKVAQLMRQASMDAQQIDDPEQFSRYLEAFGTVIQGIDPEFDPSVLRRAVAFPASKVAKKQQTEAAAVIARLRSRYGEQFEQIAQTASVEFNGKPTPVKDLLALAELQMTDASGAAIQPTSDPFAATTQGELPLKLAIDEFAEQNGRPPNAAERRQIYFKVRDEEAQRGGAGNSDYARFLARFARERGKSVDGLTVAEEKEARKQFGQADDRPPIRIDVGGMNPAVASMATKLRDDFRVDSKEFVSVAQAYNRIRASGASPSAAGDLALIFNYMKILDPGSTVREGEFANAQNAGGVEDRIIAMYNSVRTGERLAPAQRADFLNRSERLYRQALGQHQRIVRQYENDARRIGADPAFIIRDYSAGEEDAPPKPDTLPNAPGPKPKVGEIRFLPDGRKVKITGYTPDGQAITQVVR